MLLKYIQIFDQQVITWLNNLVEKWGFANKFFAEYLIYLIPVILLWLWFYDQKSKKVAFRAFVAVMLAWPIFGLIIGNLIHRVRPFELGGIPELIFHRPTYSFPSDHAAALFAVTASFWFSGNKKLSYFVLILAVVICVFRVATGLHWPSDILAGAALGILAGWLVNLFDKPLDLLYNLIIKIAQKLRLA